MRSSAYGSQTGLPVGLESNIKTHLLILEPGETLRGEDEPVVPAPALHDPEVVDGHVALPDHLVQHSNIKSLLL